jgi:hypothetical protein
MSNEEEHVHPDDLALAGCCLRVRRDHLMACVLYATIYQQSPVGLSFTTDLPQETVLFLQEIAEGAIELNVGY